MYDLSKIPRHMHANLLGWIEHGTPPGRFLSAVIENDLFSAVTRADSENLAALYHWVIFFHNQAPPGCYGPGALKTWKQT